MAKITDAEREVGQRYTTATEGGWVVAVHYRRSGHHIVTWWYGPASGVGTTSGPLDDCGPRTWTTKHDTEMALRRIFRRPSEWKRGGYEPMTVDAARLLVTQMREDAAAARRAKSTAT